MNERSKRRTHRFVWHASAAFAAAVAAVMRTADSKLNLLANGNQIHLG